MIVNNCGNCPFKVEDWNPDSAGNDVYCYCNLLNFRINGDMVNITIASYDSYETKGGKVPELQTVLPNCPLLIEELNIKYEKI